MGFYSFNFSTFEMFIIQSWGGVYYDLNYIIMKLYMDIISDQKSQ